MEPRSSLPRLIEALQRAFSQLDTDAGPETIRSIAETIFRAMSGEGRYYHTPGHALALVDETDPIQTLAALFHDVVYTQIDQGLSPEIQSILEPLLTSLPDGETGWQITEEQAEDPNLLMVKDLFGFNHQPRAFSASGSNELLSSIVMVRKLEGLLPMKVLLQITACIEATIPFRGTDEAGDGPSDKLAQRLKMITRRLNVSMHGEDIDQAILRSVAFANRDVGNFSLPDPMAFLEGTWKLLPESFPALRCGSEYELGDYYKALEGMQKFISSIDPQAVLHQYKNFPPEGEVKEKSRTIHLNLAISRVYLEIKLLSLAVLEALAEISGGDAPVRTFLGAGDKNIAKKYSDTSALVTPQVDSKDDEQTREMYRLVKHGVRGPVDSTDVKTAPIALFIYQQLGTRKVHEQLDTAHEMFTGKITPDAFLSSLDNLVVANVAEVIAQNAPRRGEILRRYLGEKTQS